ncbi:TIGR02285 family protein [Colwelliaceae bacterium 6441]
MKHVVVKFMLWTALFNLSLSFSFSLSAKELLTWRVIDWPPFYILSGKDKGQGIYDQLISKMIKALPEFEHRTMVMNTQRVLKELNKGAHVCHPSALENTQALLSKANSFLLPHRLIFDSRDTQKIAGDQTSISLINLLSDESITVGIATERYTSELNQILSQFKGKAHLSHQNNYNGLVRMFFKKRVDALIEYPPVITYAKQIFDAKMNNTSLAITELSKTNYLPVHFACPNNDWGKNVINKINQILIEEVKEDDYLAFRLKWYDKESQRLLSKYYLEDYLKDKH